MPSPFPGMDPYLEDPARWPDVHQRLITYISDALQPQIRPRYHARMGERVYIMHPPRTMYPDVVLTRQPVRDAAVVDVAVDVAVPQFAMAEETTDTPVYLTFAPVERREPFVEIIHTAGDEVVTIIEILSPANKRPGKGERLYRQKQEKILDSPAHLVEIDLLAEGLRTVAIPEEGWDSVPPFRYLVSINRAPERYRFEIYPIPLPRRLPRVRIPLQQPTPDVRLDLQAVFAQCYDNGGYADFVDYGQPPPTTLLPQEAAWVNGLLMGKGLRNGSA